MSLLPLLGRGGFLCLCLRGRFLFSGFRIGLGSGALQLGHLESSAKPRLGSVHYFPRYYGGLAEAVFGAPCDGILWYRQSFT